MRTKQMDRNGFWWHFFNNVGVPVPDTYCQFPWRVLKALGLYLFGISALVMMAVVLLVVPLMTVYIWFKGVTPENRTVFAFGVMVWVMYFGGAINMLWVLLKGKLESVNYTAERGFVQKEPGMLSKIYRDVKDKTCTRIKWEYK